MKERWRVYGKKADFAAIGKRFAIDPVVARIIRNRDILEEADINRYLNGSLEDLHDPHQMKDLDLAVDLLQEAVAKGKKIAIASDFDDDGIFAGMILYEGIGVVGGEAVLFAPHRVREGYGLNERIVGEAYEQGCRVILTCDNGIAAFAAIEYAKQLEMTVIVTDHHEVPFEEIDGVLRYQLPVADAIVNPKQEDCTYPFSGLCGAGVAYKVIQALYEREGINPSGLNRLLEYAAIATVADVMDLVDENRIIVKEGLKRLRKTGNVGLLALMEETGITKEQLSAYHIGFILGPCFNAAGRLGTVQSALDLLMTDDQEEAKQRAAALKALNDSRKDMTAKGVEQAFAVIENADWQEDTIYLIYLPDCHESIAGIIAGRIRERYYRPVLVFTNAENGIKASGRSIPAYDMFMALNACKDLFSKFGGHAMAAGLSMQYSDLEELRRRLNEASTLTSADLEPVVNIDVPMPLSYVTEELVQQLEILAPFGKCNEKPLFAQQHVRILYASVVGKNQNVCKLQVSGAEGQVMDALYFGDIPAFFAFLTDTFGEKAVEDVKKGRKSDIDIGITYYPQINEFRGNRTIQVAISNYCHIK